MPLFKYISFITTNQLLWQNLSLTNKHLNVLKALIHQSCFNSTSSEHFRCALRDFPLKTGVLSNQSSDNKWKYCAQKSVWNCLKEFSVHIAPTLTSFYRFCQSSISSLRCSMRKDFSGSSNAVICVSSSCCFTSRPPLLLLQIYVPCAQLILWMGISCCSHVVAAWWSHVKEHRTCANIPIEKLVYSLCW